MNINVSLKRVWGLVDSVENLVHKILNSRKAMAAVGGVSAGLAAHNLGLVAASVLTYLGVEGYVDSKSVQFAQTVAEAPAVDASV